jgi:hypothetical protein
MKIIIIILTLGYSFLGFSQNFQTIKSNQINYFGTVLEDYFLATRTDSLEIMGTDSIFYSFKTW